MKESTIEKILYKAKTALEPGEPGSNLSVLSAEGFSKTPLVTKCGNYVVLQGHGYACLYDCEEDVVMKYWKFRQISIDELLEDGR